MANKTALQQFIEWGDKMIKSNPPKTLSFHEAIDKAEELLSVEKDQIINAWLAEDNELQRMAAEKYYQENYGKK